MIPKTIHYCWFGKNPKPELIDQCIASWYRYCPDYRIVEWNEDNWDVSRYTFAKQAYEAQKWAFVSDVARLDVIYQHGGIYLDTDIELLRPVDDLLENEAFFFFETARNIATGLGFGAVPKHTAVNAMLEYYNEKEFIWSGRKKTPPCPVWNTEALLSYAPGLIRNGATQEIREVLLLSGSEYLHFAINHSTGNWDGKGVNIRKNKPFKSNRVKSFLRRPKNFDFVEEHWGSAPLKAYTFVVYDLLENGCMYYVKRILQRIKSR